MKKSFTIIELLITISIIALLAVALFVLLNPKKQIEKSQDAKRKGELSSLKKTFEDYYNDKSCYPRPTEVCYKDNTGLSCPICGKNTPSALLPYVSQLPCDPQNPNKEYLYQVDNTICPSWFRIYSMFSDSEDVTIEEVGCRWGCGPAFAYSYGVSSPNIDLERASGPSPTPTTAPSPTPILCPDDPIDKLCIKNGCQTCGTFAQCKMPNSCDQPLQLYYPNCQTPCLEK